VPQVRVVGDDGEQFGVLETRDAIRRAREQGMDLVEVAPNAEPPVCKIVVVTVKEVKFRPGTDVHDYEYRMKRSREWLQEGDKVKATIWFRGREMTHRELGARILEQLEKDLADVGDVEMRPRMEGNQMFTIFQPKRNKSAKHHDKPQEPGTASQAPASGNQNPAS